MNQNRHVQAPRQRAKPQQSVVADVYPNITKWIKAYGWIELGADLAPLERRSFIRAFDASGLVWAGDETYPTIDDTLRDLDDALGNRMREQLSE